MAEPFLGTIVMFGGDFAPRGWAFCNGQLLPVAQNNLLFTVLGTTYGGDGIRTFALPNLKGRVPIHPGQVGGTTGTDYLLGEHDGDEFATIFKANMPSHTHRIRAHNERQDEASPENNFLGKADIYAASETGFYMSEYFIGYAGPYGFNIPIVQPVLCLNFIIAIQGLFPARQQ